MSPTVQSARVNLDDSARGAYRASEKHTFAILGPRDVILVVYVGSPPPTHVD